MSCRLGAELEIDDRGEEIGQMSTEVENGYTWGKVVVEGALLPLS